MSGQASHIIRHLATSRFVMLDTKINRVVALLVDHRIESLVNGYPMDAQPEWGSC